MSDAPVEFAHLFDRVFHIVHMYEAFFVSASVFHTEVYAIQYGSHFAKRGVLRSRKECGGAAVSGDSEVRC